MLSCTIPPSQEDLYELENACTTHPYGINSDEEGKILPKRCKNKKILDLGRGVSLSLGNLRIISIGGVSVEGLGGEVLFET